MAFAYTHPLAWALQQKTKAGSIRPGARFYTDFQRKSQKRQNNPRNKNRRGDESPPAAPGPAFFSGDGGALWGGGFRIRLDPTGAPLRLPRAAPRRGARAPAGRDAEEDGERRRSDRGGQAAHRLVGALHLRHLLRPHA